MKALNYAMLKYMTTVPEASAHTVMQALQGEYGKFKAFNHRDIFTALMTAKVNALLEESRFELKSDGELEVFFRAHPEGAATINKYIKD